MSRRQFIVCFVLLAIIGTAGMRAFSLWREQHRTAIARAALPVWPNPTRWPAEFMTALEEASAAAQTAKDPVEPLGRLTQLYLANAFDAEADRVLQALRQLDPKNARWAYLQGELHRRRGDEAAVEQALETTVALDPTYAPAWLRLGERREAREVLDRAEECYLNAARQAPGDARARFALIAFEARHGKRADPRASMHELVQHYPEIRELHDFLAQLHAAAGDAVRATEQRRLAAKARHHLGTDDPWRDELANFCHDPDRLVRWAVRLDRENRPLEAEKLLKRAVRLAPQEPAPRKVLARFFEANDRVPEAGRLLATAVVELPDDPELQRMWSRTLCREHKPNEGAAAARAALQRWPDNGPLHAAMGRALREAREPEEAVKALREAIRLDPTQVEARCDLAFCLANLKQPDEARTFAEQALAMRPDHPEALLLLGSLALDNHDLERAETMVMRLHALQPDEPGWQLLFGGWHLAKGQQAQEAKELTEAARLFDAGLEVAPQFTPLLREAALLAARRAQYLQVVDLLERYLRLEPKDLDWFALLVTGYRELEQPEMVERTLERGLRLAEQLGDKASIAEFNRQLDEL